MPYASLREFVDLLEARGELVAEEVASSDAHLAQPLAAFVRSRSLLDRKGPGVTDEVTGWITYGLEQSERRNLHRQTLTPGQPGNRH